MFVGFDQEVEGTWRQIEHADSITTNLSDNSHRIEGLVSEMQRRSDNKRAVDILLSQVEAARREQEQRVVSAQPKIFDIPTDDIAHASPCDHGSLRIAGRSGGIDDIGKMKWRQACFTRERIAGAFSGPPRRLAVQIQNRRVAQVLGLRAEALLHTGPHAALREDHLGRAVFEHVGQPLRGVRWVQRHIGPARLECGQQRNHHLDAALHQDSDEVVGFDSQRTQAMRKLVGLGIQFAVAQLPVALAQRYGVRIPGSLCLEQFVNTAPVRAIHFRVVPLHQQLVALRLGQDLQCVNGLSLVGHHGRRNAAQVLDVALDAGLVEQCAGVAHFAGNSPALPLMQRQRQIKLGNALGQLNLPQLQPRQNGSRGLLAFPGKHHLEQRAVCEAAHRAHDLHHLLEGQVLVLLCTQRLHLDALQPLPHAGAASAVQPQRQRIDEEADQRLELGAPAIGHRRADHHFVLATQPHQYRTPGCQQGHEQGRAVTLAQRLQARTERRVKCELDCPSRMVLALRARPVRGQLDQLGRASQRALPVFALALQNRTAQPAPLPRSEVGVLDLQRGQRVAPALAERAVQRAQLATQ